LILLTAVAGTQSTVDGFETGADDYLVKPFDTRTLLARVQNLIDTRRMLRTRFSEEMLLQPAGIPIQSADQAFLEKIMGVLEEHMGDSRFGVYELAEEIGYSRRQLHRKITAITNQTPGQLIRRMRLERAARLLKGNAGNIAEVAYAVGFDKPKYFSRVFRETYGENPSAFMTR
jgi:transcriptional regulator GlxA family with amidase domain